MMTKSRRESYKFGWFNREIKIGYRLARKHGNQYNRKIRHCKSDNYESRRFMFVRTVA